MFLFWVCSLTKLHEKSTKFSMVSDIYPAIWVENSKARVKNSLESETQIYNTPPNYHSNIMTKKVIFICQNLENIVPMSPFWRNFKKKNFSQPRNEHRNYVQKHSFLDIVFKAYQISFKPTINLWNYDENKHENYSHKTNIKYSKYLTNKCYN